MYGYLLARVIDALELREHRPRPIGPRSFKARCPVHGGRDYDSLTVTEGRDGMVLLTCHSKACPWDEITLSLGLELQDVFPQDDPWTSP